MNIIYLGTSDFPGGGAAGRCMHMIAKGLVGLGHDVTVFMCRRMRSGPAQEIVDGIKVVWSSGILPDECKTGLQRKRYVVKTRLLFIWNFFRIVSGNHFDWVILDSLGAETMLGILPICHKYKVKLASQYGDLVHADFGSKFFGTLSSKLGQLIGVRFSDLILNCGSSVLAEQFRVLSPKTNIVPLLPPVDTKIFISGNGKIIRERYNLKDIKVVTYLGGFKFFEGVEDLINGLTDTLNRDKSVRLVIAGGAVKSDFNVIQTLVTSLPCHDQILLPGQLDLDDVANLLAASDVLVLPKIDHPVNHHAMPIKLGEYFAAGKPVVSAAIGGIPDYLEHRKNGLLYTPGDLNALRIAVEELLYDAELANSLGLAGQRTAMGNFDVQVVAASLEREFQKGVVDVQG